MTTTLFSIGSLSAPLIAIVVGVIVLLFGLGSGGAEARRFLPMIAIVGLVIAGAAAYLPSQSDIVLPAFGGGMVSDARGGLFCLLLCVVAALAIAMAPGYLEEKGINQGEFYALILFSASGAMIMACANDLVNVFVGLEVLSVALYILSGFARRERRSEEAAVKYFLLGAFASGFLLYGIALIYGSVGLAAQAANLSVPSAGASLSYTNFTTIAATLTQATGLASSPLFISGVGLVIVGLGFKAAIVPFHSYAPDVYEGAPTPVTAFMSVAAKAGAFAVLLRLFEAVLGTPGAPALSVSAFAPYHAVIWLMAAATMIVGNVLAVRQTNIKRMLAYSSIAHAGYILLGVMASASGTASALLAQDAVRFYLFAYAFMNMGAFAVVVWLGRDGGEYLDIRAYAGLGRRNPLAAGVLTIFLLSLAGIPLTAGFLGKLYLFMSAIKGGEAVLAVIGLLASAIGVFYYLNLIVQMYFREPEHDFSAPRGGAAKGVAILCAIATILFGIVPIHGLSPSVSAAPVDGDTTPAPAASSPAAASGDTSAAPVVSPEPAASASPAAAEAVSATPTPSADGTPSPDAAATPEASPIASATPEPLVAPSSATAATPAPLAASPAATTKP